KKNKKKKRKKSKHKQGSSANESNGQSVRSSRRPLSVDSEMSVSTNREQASNYDELDEEDRGNHDDNSDHSDGDSNSNSNSDHSNNEDNNNNNNNGSHMNGNESESDMNFNTLSEYQDTDMDDRYLSSKKSNNNNKNNEEDETQKQIWEAVSEKLESQLLITYALSLLPLMAISALSWYFQWHLLPLFTNHCDAAWMEVGLWTWTGLSCFQFAGLLAMVYYIRHVWRAFNVKRELISAALLEVCFSAFMIAFVLTTPHHKFDHTLCILYLHLIRTIGLFTISSSNKITIKQYKINK
ncbi:hypothetical protein RFI_29582, partial [Reticulomyxa filosa]